MLRAPLLPKAETPRKPSLGVPVMRPTGKIPKPKPLGPVGAGLPLTFVILGPPRTKKTHQRIVRCGKFSKILPSEAYIEWNGIAVPQLQLAMKAAPITCDVNCRALFLRQTNIGDATGFYQALADTLQDAGVILNDRFIVSWDGSRLDKDAANPRVIVTLEAAE